MTPRIDAHLHYWRPDRGDYGWLTPALGHLHQDHLPADAEPHLAATGIDGLVLVQAARQKPRRASCSTSAGRTPASAASSAGST